MVSVVMEFDDGNAQAARAETYLDALAIARGWLGVWVAAPASEAIPGIVKISIERSS